MQEPGEVGLYRFVPYEGHDDPLLHGGRGCRQTPQGGNLKKEEKKGKVREGAEGSGAVLPTPSATRLS